MVGATYPGEVIEQPGPLSRHDRQQRTREALIDAARDVFAEDGYHAASLDRIARVAGRSKGAVYSNFASKSALFMAVMDHNLELSRGDLRDPFAEPANPASTGRDLAAREGYPQSATQGFALATLEFIARAARDIYLQAGLTDAMPPANVSYIEPEERAVLRDWFRSVAGARVAAN